MLRFSACWQADRVSDRTRIVISGCEINRSHKVASMTEGEDPVGPGQYGADPYVNFGLEDARNSA
jgi:hypothetical protein